MARRKEENPGETTKGGRRTAWHVDARGRRIEVSSLNALDYYRFSKVMGPSSDAAMDMAAVVATVRKINTTHYAMPSNERDVELLIQELDFDGIAAAGIALGKLAKVTEGEAKNEVDAAKN